MIDRRSCTQLKISLSSTDLWHENLEKIQAWTGFVIQVYHQDHRSGCLLKKLILTPCHMRAINTFIIWLAPRAGKMNQIARCDWLPERARWSHLTRCIPHEKFPRKPYNKSFIDHVCSVKMVGYWPRSFFASLWTSTSSRSINTQKKNMANIQPSWPHTWSITHTNNVVIVKSLKDGQCLDRTPTVHVGVWQSWFVL